MVARLFFGIQDVFPITEKYVKREFIKFCKHFMITSEALDNKEIIMVSDTKFTKLFIQSPDNTINSNNLYSSSTKINSAKASLGALY